MTKTRFRPFTLNECGDVLDVNEMAKLFHVGTDAITKRCRHGQIPGAFKQGKSVLQQRQDKGGSRTMRCSICGRHIKGDGNSASPVNKGTCCDFCNYSVVVPARLKIHNERKKSDGKSYKAQD